MTVEMFQIKLLLAGLILLAINYLLASFNVVRLKKLLDF